ncbi:MAG: hypothetical protein KC777_03355 [Cyanobacteria bacterium HKST-UBA02]|nr:hypothetical protein [Cyanobacteria bacterium HKST-UBA02]
MVTDSTDENRKGSSKSILGATGKIFRIVALALTIFLLIFAAYLWYQFVPRVAVHADDGSGSQRLLFIGNSITFNHDVPGLLVMLVRAGQPDKKVSIQSFTRAGAALDELVQIPVLKSAFQKNWDRIIIQPDSGSGFGGPSVVTGELSRTMKAAGVGPPKCAAVMTFADKAYFAYQSVISQTYRRSGKQLGMEVLPVGDFMFFAQERLPDTELYDADEHHESRAGALIYALSVYRMMFRGSLDKNRLLEGLKEPDKSLVAKLWDVLDSFQDVAPYRPEFSIESGCACIDLAELWASNGQPAEAERLSARRLKYVNQIFPGKHKVQTGTALRNLAEAQLSTGEPAKVKTGLENARQAWKILSSTRREDRWRLADLESAVYRAAFRQEIGRAEKALIDAPVYGDANGKSEFSRLTSKIKEEGSISGITDLDIKKRAELRRQVAELLSVLPSERIDALLGALNHSLAGSGLRVALVSGANRFYVGRLDGNRISVRYSAGNSKDNSGD